MSTSTSPAPATGPRAMAEQSILKIIWPPDGRPTWEDRHKIPRIEQVLGQLLDIVESDDVKLTVIKARESQKLTAQVLELRRQGLTMAQIADVTGLTEYAVIHRISNAKRSLGNPRDLSPNSGDDAALRSAAPDQSVEVNKMIADTDSADHIVEANDMVVQAPPNVRPEKVPLTDEQKDTIIQLHQEGRSNTDIAAIIARRKPAKNVPAVQPGYLPSQPTEDQTPKPAPAQEAKPLTNEERRQTLLDMKIERLSYTNTAAQIAEKLSVPGDVWTEGMVNERMQKIRGKA